MIVTGLMRYHIRYVTQPSLVGQESLAGGSSAADGVASTPRPVVGNGKAKPHQTPTTPTATAIVMGPQRRPERSGLKEPGAC